jgi:GT2 family glycosyltransferase
MNKIAILLTCFNRKEKSLACLSSVYKSIQDTVKDSTFDIYLVDDNSTDGTSLAIRENFDDIKLITGDGFLFWNRGMHLAWSESARNDYDFYLWLNDDTILKNLAFDTLLKDSALFKNEAIICGVCESAKTGEITYGGYRKVNHKIILPSGKPQVCSYFNGNIVLIPRTAYAILGNLDPVFHHSLGDYDYGLRADEQGIKAYITSESIGYCEKNELPVWCNPNYSFLKRLNYFYSPLGAVPFQHFIFAKRHYGYYKAIKNFFSNHLRLIYPSIWLKL